MDEEYIDDTEQENLDLHNEYQEGMIDSLDENWSEQKQQQSLFNLFWKVVKLKNSTKVANLTKVEIGNTDVSMRDALLLSRLGNMFGNKVYGDFFSGMGEVTASTSMSKDGWLGELFVSTKKTTTKSRKNSELTPEKWRMFKKQNQQA